MPTSCCVPGCKSNYNTDSSVTVFRFPKDPIQCQKWLNAIHRANFTPSKRSVVCIRHFDERYIVREDSVTKPDGTVLTVKRQRVKLAADACPTVFENQPVYLTRNLPPPRRDPASRREEIRQREEDRKSQVKILDTINSLSDIKERYKLKCDDHAIKHFHLHASEDTLNFFSVYQTKRGNVKVLISLLISKDLSFNVLSRDDIIINDDPKILEISYGRKRLCLWSQLNALLEYLFNENRQININCSTEDHISSVNSSLGSLIDDCLDNPDVSKRLTFLQEQFNLLFKKKVSYCVNTLVWFATLLFAFPGSYNYIRVAKLLTMPHPKYLNKFTFKLGVNTSGLQSGHMDYLKKKVSVLEENEKLCCLLLDEIYVKPEITYKGGKVEGLVVNDQNAPEPASTVQVFMISSIMSKYKDVVGLFPIKNLSSDMLFTLTNLVIKLLTEIGFKVFCLISDNNRVNRNTFERFCGGTLQTKFVNPYCESQNIYVMFDPVHLFKCIRNNWLNQVDNRQTFVFPNFDKNDVKEMACVSDLKILHLSEENNCVKLAPALSKKVLYPTSIERQNVHLCCRLFDEKNIAALNENSSLTKTETKSSTAHFIQVILKWWKIVNVKHMYKGVKFNDENFKPIQSVTDTNFVFLKSFSKWLVKWDELVVQGEELTKAKRRGKLTNETHVALLHTVNTLMEIISFLLGDMKLSYVLLGKFQTDPLEARFSQYRQMSGACYHVSVKQVLESEKKTKNFEFD